MIVLDTNVLSELASERRAPEVTAWLARQAATDLFTTPITQAEVLYGIELMPAGRKREALQTHAETMFGEDFADRILPFDSSAAEAYAAIAASRRAMGRPISEADAQIAAIARSNGAVLASRNTKDFAHCGIKVLNPWAE